MLELRVGGAVVCPARGGIEGVWLLRLGWGVIWLVVLVLSVGVVALVRVVQAFAVWIGVRLRIGIVVLLFLAVVSCRRIPLPCTASGPPASPFSTAITWSCCSETAAPTRPPVPMHHPDILLRLFWHA